MDDDLGFLRFDWLSKMCMVLIILIIVVTINIEEIDDVNLVDKQARLAPSLNEAFKIVSNLTYWKVFYRGTSNYAPIDDKPIGLGKRYKEYTYVPILGDVMFDCVILSYDPPQHISYLCDNMLKTRVSINLEHSNEVPTHPTLITYKIDSRRRSYFFKEYVSFIVRIYEDALVSTALRTLQYFTDRSVKLSGI